MGAAMARYQIGKVAAERGMTIYRLARVAKVNEARLRLLVNNKLKNVTVGTLEHIAIALDVPLSEVFEPTSLSEVPQRPITDTVEEIEDTGDSNSTDDLDSGKEEC